MAVKGPWPSNRQLIDHGTDPGNPSGEGEGMRDLAGTIDPACEFDGPHANGADVDGARDQHRIVAKDFKNAGL